ncbi:unnamed protein product [Brassica oleracea var. botrytis]
MFPALFFRTFSNYGHFFNLNPFKSTKKAIWHNSRFKILWFYFLQIKWDSDSHSRVMTTPKPTIKPNEYKFYECSHKPTHHLINNIEKFHSTWPNIRTHLP